MKFSGTVTFTTACPKITRRISGGMTEANSFACMEKSITQKLTDLITLSSGITAGWLLLDSYTQIWSSYYRTPRQRSKKYSQGNQMIPDTQKQCWGERSQEALWSRFAKEANLREVYRISRERKYAGAL